MKLATKYITMLFLAIIIALLVQNSGTVSQIVEATGTAQNNMIKAYLGKA